MKEHTYLAPYGAKITYWITGAGAPLICLHGSGESKELWERTGWLQVLAEQYRVIVPDLRGFGNSTVFHDPEHYGLDRMLGDLTGILRECGFADTGFLMFGHSYGATITFQAVRAGLPVVKAVCASGSMGEQFFQEVCPAEHAEYELLAEAKRAGTLASLTQYSKEEQAFIQTEDMEKFSALFDAWSRFEPVAPEELAGKVSIYSGTKDYNQEMVEATTEHRKIWKDLGVETRCFEGLNHQELITSRETCQSWVLGQLAENPQEEQRS